MWCFRIPLMAALLVFSTRAAPSDSSKCESLHDTLAFASCVPIVNEMKQYMKVHKGDLLIQDVVKEMTPMCEKVENCLSPIRCKAAADTKEILNESCEMINFGEANNERCLGTFFKAAYMAQQLADEPSCFHRHDFLAKDLTRRQEAYSNGQSCFTEHITQHCDQSSIDYFSKNYQKFADAISIKPPGSDCKSAHNLLNALHCKALGKAFEYEIRKMQNKRTLPGVKTTAVMAMQLCRDAQTCMNDSCLVRPQMHERLNEHCDRLHLAQSHFFICLNRIWEEKPDLSKFECAGDVDLYKMEPHTACEKFTSNKECIKEIMSSFCGEESVADYDKLFEEIGKNFVCV